MKCDSCSSARVLSLAAKSRDSNTVKLEDFSWDGYAPEIPFICNVDYIRTAICLDCGKCQGQFPINPSCNSPRKAFLLWVGENYFKGDLTCYWEQSFTLNHQKNPQEKEGEVTLGVGEFALWDGGEDITVYSTVEEKGHRIAKGYEPDLTYAIPF